MCAWSSGLDQGRRFLGGISDLLGYMYMASWVVGIATAVVYI